MVFQFVFVYVLNFLGLQGLGLYLMGVFGLGIFVGNIVGSDWKWVLRFFIIVRRIRVQNQFFLVDSIEFRLRV